ncbi:ABC transporter permease [Treponema sp. J25]|uniref:ABC transporter permease subunit n=1 Tax=Treponema sp. J25 TaxID=2094121 RepID=UPI0014049AB8|nr:ABC transporter permease [Treponema sp. J25]
MMQLLLELGIASTPLFLAALGALVTDCSGTLGIFLEGSVTMGAYLSYVLGVYSGSSWGAIIIPALAGGLVGGALGWFVTVTGANPFVAALAMNMLIGAYVSHSEALLFGSRGVLQDSRFSVLALVRDKTLYTSLSMGFALLTALVLWYALYRTPWGLRLRCSGRSLEAARLKGIRPEGYRISAWAIGSALAAAAGSLITLRLGAFVPGSTTGRGWIALVLIFLGFKKIGGVLVGTFLFSLLERIGFASQARLHIPATILLGLPFFLALMLYTVSQVIQRKQWRHHDRST